MGRRPGKKGGGYFSDSITRLLADDMQSGNFMCSIPSRADSDECRALFLGMYDEAALRSRFASIGLFDLLAHKGYADVALLTHRDSSGVSRLQVYRETPLPDNLLIDARFSETLFTPFRAFCEDCDGNGPCTFHVIVIEWVETRDPSAAFTKDRPQLPGQHAPGLGVLAILKKFVAVLAGEISRDGFMNVPDHIHSALMYSDAFMFVDPEREGYIRALRRDLKGVSLGDITWGFITGTVYDRASGASEKYRPAEQLYPFSGRLKRHYDSKLYAKGVEAVLRKKGFRFDRALMEERRRGILAKKKPGEL